MNKELTIRKILDAATTGKQSDAIKALDEFETVLKEKQFRIEELEFKIKELENLKNHD